MTKAKTSVTAKKVEGSWEIKAVPQYKDALRQAGCKWDDKKVCWIYTGEKLPDAVQQIVDGVYGMEGLLNAPESPKTPIKVSEPPQPAIQASAPPPVQKNDVISFTDGDSVEWDSPSGVLKGTWLKIERELPAHSRVQVEGATLVIPTHLLRPANRWPASNSAYVLIPPGHAIPGMYETESIPAAEKIVHVRWFTPDSSWTWYIVEYDPKSDVAFGYAYNSDYPDGAEWGYIPLTEIRASRGHYNLRIERDLHFSPTPFGKIREFSPKSEARYCTQCGQLSVDLYPSNGELYCWECVMKLPPCNEADGTSPYMVENDSKRDLKPGQDWLGWICCDVCGVFLDSESNRAAQQPGWAKPLMGLPYGKVICRNCHAAKHNLPEIRIDTPSLMLPVRQVEFLQALAKGEPVVKNAATRKALREHGFITDTNDWAKIEITEAGEAWAAENGIDLDFPVPPPENLKPIPRASDATLKTIKKGSTIYASEDIHEQGKVIVPAGTKGKVENRGPLALTVRFENLPHGMLCLWDMVTTAPPVEDDLAKTDAWVKQVNEAARAADAAFAETLNMSPVVHLALEDPDVQAANDKFVQVASGGAFKTVSAFKSATRVTPLRQQYLDIKKEYPNHILFYRLGDFYETFDDDAETAARELDLVLTGRPISRDERVPMAGVPHHAVDQYINLLVEKGYKVAVAEQMSEPDGRGIVERKVTRTLEPNLPEKSQVSECEPQVDETWIWHHVSDHNQALYR